MKAHRSNYIALIESQVVDLMDERGLSESQAFSYLASSWIGYELDDHHFTDGKSDRGVDFWFGGDSGFEFFQVKSHELTAAGRLQTTPFDKSGVNDLRRIRELLTEQQPPVEANRKVQELVKEWNMALAKKRLAPEPEELEATLTLVVIGDGLTAEAEAEYELFSCLPKSSIGEVPLRVRTRLIALDDLLENRWRQVNRDWKDKTGVRRNTIDLQPELRTGKASWIPGHSSAVFYCRAIDLIQAFENFGYQIFEPNVRAHIRRSKVNTAIRSSLAHSQSRREFRFLNNGVTVTCKGFKKPTQNRQNFRVTEPGVVNGLQTVVAMHQEYADLNQDEKRDLEESCFVLVRLLTESAVGDIGRVVLATNTQNPMQARNLRSNEEEQVLYERLFAEMGWFFERKQGAWDAFKEDPARWRSLSSYRKTDFLGPASGQGRRRERRVDNEELAQTWLAFLGFSDEAVHRKRELFEDDDLYRLAFLARPREHGSALEYSTRRALDESETEAPSPQMLLTSYFARELARGVPLSAREAREEAIERLQLDRGESREVIDAKLSQDYGYVSSRALNGMSFLFCDFLGYVLFRAFGKQVHYVGPALLKTPSVMSALDAGSTEDAVSAIREGRFDPGDVVPVAWSAFEHLIDELLAGTWRDSYHAAPVKSRFLHERETRSRIARAFNDLEAYMERSQLTKAWAAHIPPGTGMSAYFKQELEGLGA